MESWSVWQRLDLAGSRADTNLNTPSLANLWETLALDTLAWSQDDLLLALNLVTLKDPARSVLDQVALVALGDLLEELGHLRLTVWLDRLCLLLLLLSSLRQQTRWHDHPHHQLVRVVGCKQEVGWSSRDLGVVLASNDGIADNRTKAIDLSTELDLDCLVGLEHSLRLLGVGGEGSVWGHVGAWRDGARVGDSLDNFLALVDLCNLILQELVAALADLDNLCALDTPSCARLAPVCRVCSGAMRT